MQQSPNTQTGIGPLERGLMPERLHLLGLAVSYVFDATGNAYPDILVPTIITEEQLFHQKTASISEYNANVERNLRPHPAPTVIETPVVEDWRAEQRQAAITKVNSAHQYDFPLSQEMIDA